MAAGFKTGGGDGVHARFVERGGLGKSGRRTDGEDALLAAARELIGRGDAEDKAEHGGRGFEHRFELIGERRVQPLRTFGFGHAEFAIIGLEQRPQALELKLRQVFAAWIGDGNPKIEIERI
jgi:hypothetical protein